MKKVVSVIIEIFIDEESPDVQKGLQAKLDHGMTEEEVWKEVRQMTFEAVKEEIEAEFNIDEMSCTVTEAE